jgi:hypothetical protein
VDRYRMAGAELAVVARDPVAGIVLVWLSREFQSAACGSSQWLNHGAAERNRLRRTAVPKSSGQLHRPS